MTFTSRLIELAEPYIQVEIKKPFLVELLNGNLPVDKFIYYIKVDFPYLLDYNQILALGIYKSDDLELMNLMVKILNANMRETGLNESFIKKYGITQEELDKQKMGPVKYSYTRHELAIGQRGLLGELLAALLPCQWGYGEVARRMVKNNPIQADNPYKGWFDFYTSEDYEKLGTECMELIDRIVMDYSETQLKQIEESFLKSCYFEVVCWDAYYAKEDWKI